MARDMRKEGLAGELGLVTLEAAAVRTGYPAVLLRRWARTGRFPIFLVGREMFVCPELVKQMCCARGTGTGIQGQGEMQ